jgi:hypothetical protein
MAANSWLHLQTEDPRHKLPAPLGAHDPIGARDCGWVEQMLPFLESHVSSPGWVIDPFCGFGSTLVAASLCGVPAVGVEISGPRSEIARQRLALLGAEAASYPVFTGSVAQACMREQLAAPGDGQPRRRFSLCLTNIPYFGCSQPSGLADESSTGQLYAAPHYAPYLQGLRDVFVGVHQLLEPDGWCVVMAQNLRLGGTFVPLAWDVSRLLSDRFVLHEERLLIYDRASEPGAPLTSPTNRAHEYALVMRKQAAAMDLAEGKGLLARMAAEGFEFIVYGSFARWLLAEPLVKPGDIDLLCPPDDVQLGRLLQWLAAEGFALTSWNTDLRPPVSIMALAQRHYLRARRLRADGLALQVDLTIGVSRAEFDARQAASRPATAGLPYPILAHS